MVDVNGTDIVKGATVTVTGVVTAVSEKEHKDGSKDQKDGPSTVTVTIEVPAPVFYEYPKATEWGVANSKEHELELRRGPKLAEDAAAKDKAAKDKADKELDAEAAKPAKKADK